MAATFPQAGFRFLKQLAKNNDRTWFNERKSTYVETVQEPLHALVSEVNVALKKARIPLASDPRRIAFRIHRDVRFSNDKSPYKTHASAVLHPGGDRTAPGVLYLHLDPAGSFCAAGFYQPENEQLRALRSSIVARPKPFLKLVHSLGHPMRDEDALKRLPRGFEGADEALWPYLKMKSFVTSMPMSAEQLCAGDAVEGIVSFTKDALPLLRWGWSALT